MNEELFFVAKIYFKRKRSNRFFFESKFEIASFDMLVMAKDINAAKKKIDVWAVEYFRDLHPAKFKYARISQTLY